MFSMSTSLRWPAADVRTPVGADCGEPDKQGITRRQMIVNVGGISQDNGRGIGSGHENFINDGVSFNIAGQLAAPLYCRRCRCEKTDTRKVFLPARMYGLFSGPFCIIPFA